VDSRPDRSRDRGRFFFFGELIAALMDYAEKHFSLQKVYQGQTILEHLHSVVDQTGEVPEELELPPFPKAIDQVWYKFLEVHRGRTYGMSGVNPISFQDLQAWSSVTGAHLSGWEIEVIMKLDRLWLESIKDDSEDS